MSKIPFPQANDFNKMLSFLYLFSKKITKAEVSNQMEINMRQVDYYINAWKYLGVIGKDLESSPLVFVILNSSFKEQRKIIKKILSEHPVIGNYFVSDIINKEEFLSEFKNYSFSTINRRLSTIKSWKKWLGKE